MLRRVSDPDLSLPGDVGQVLSHCFPVQKGGHEDEASGRSREKIFELIVSKHVDRAMGGHRFDENEPVLFGAVDDNVRHLAVWIDLDAEAFQILALPLIEWVD